MACGPMGQTSCDPSQSVSQPRSFSWSRISSAVSAAASRRFLTTGIRACRWPSEHCHLSSSASGRGGRCADFPATAITSNAVGPASSPTHDSSHTVRSRRPSGRWVPRWSTQLDPPGQKPAVTPVSGSIRAEEVDREASSDRPLVRKGTAPVEALEHHLDEASTSVSYLLDIDRREIQSCLVRSRRLGVPSGEGRSHSCHPLNLSPTTLLYETLTPFTFELFARLQGPQSSTRLLGSSYH